MPLIRDFLARLRPGYLPCDAGHEPKVSSGLSSTSPSAVFWSSSFSWRTPMTPTRSSSSLCATKWPRSDGKSSARPLRRRIVRSWRHSIDCFPGLAGLPSASHRRRCSPGTDGWWAGTGPTRTADRDARRERPEPSQVRRHMRRHRGCYWPREDVGGRTLPRGQLECRNARLHIRPDPVDSWFGRPHAEHRGACPTRRVHRECGRTGRRDRNSHCPEPPGATSWHRPSCGSDLLRRVALNRRTTSDA